MAIDDRTLRKDLEQVMSIFRWLLQKTEPQNESCEVPKPARSELNSSFKHVRRIFPTKPAMRKAKSRLIIDLAPRQYKEEQQLFPRLELYDQLLEIGRSQRFDEITRIPGAGNHAEVVRFAGSGLEGLLNFCKVLEQGDRRALIRAVAMYEDTVAGIGSVTTLQRLVPLADDPKGDLLDWILRNTRAFVYYHHGARSLAEHKKICERIAARKAETLAREQERELEATERRATVATGNLYNAVRRGDIKAVRALRAQGADPSEARTPDGKSLLAFARHMNREDILAELERPK